MLFHIRCLDRPDCQDLRKKNRQDHLRYIQQNYAHLMQCAGPILDVQTQEMKGSVMIVDLSDMQAVQEMIKNDPYTAVNLFENVEISLFKKVFPS